MLLPQRTCIFVKDRKKMEYLENGDEVLIITDCGDGHSFQRHEIVTVSCVCTDGKIYVFTDDDEESLISRKDYEKL